MKLLLLVLCLGIVSCAGKYRVSVSRPIAPTTVRVTPALKAEGDKAVKRGLQIELGKRGFQIIDSTAWQQGNEGLLVSYSDEWKWDMAMFLRSLDVSFTDPQTGLVRGTAHYQNRFWHTFPNPENVTRRMFEAMDKKGAFAR